MIEACELTKRYDEKLAVDTLVVHRPARDRDRVPRPQRRREVHHHADDAGTRPPELRLGAGQRQGLDAEHVAPLHEVGALLEARAVHTGRSARNHLRVLAATSGISKARVEQVIDMVGLGDVADQRVAGFSLGMGERLGVAAALLGDPQTLILDEPVNGLDLDGIRWIRSLLTRLAAEGRTVFLSSHLMSEMAVTADHVIACRQGPAAARPGDGRVRSARRPSSPSAYVRRTRAASPSTCATRTPPSPSTGTRASSCREPPARRSATSPGRLASPSRAALSPGCGSLEDADLGPDARDPRLPGSGHDHHHALRLDAWHRGRSSVDRPVTLGRVIVSEWLKFRHPALDAHRAGGSDGGDGALRRDHRAQHPQPRRPGPRGRRGVRAAPGLLPRPAADGRRSACWWSAASTARA